MPHPSTPSPIIPRRAAFSRPSVDRDVSFEAVYAMHHDSIGFVWVGTQRGLYRLAGRQVREFITDGDSAGTLPGKFIVAIGEDAAGWIWIGTYDGGPARYNPRLDRFDIPDLGHASPADSVVRCFAQTPDGRFFIGTNGSLTAVDLDSLHYTKFSHPPIDDLRPEFNDRYRALHLLDDHTLLVGTAVGAFLFDLRDDSFTHLRFDERGLLGPRRPGIIDIAACGHQVLLASSSQIYRLDRDAGKLDLIEPLVNPPEELTRLAITSIASDSDPERLWIGTTNSLLRFEPATGEYSQFISDEADPRSPAGGSVHALMHDRSNMLWIGMGQGISQIDLRYNFEHHYILDESERTITVSAVHHDEHDTCWLGTTDGLWKYSMNSRTATRYSMGGENQGRIRDNNTVRQVVEGKGRKATPKGSAKPKGKREDGRNADGAESLWIGTANGLFEWDPVECRVVNRYEAPVNTLGERDYSRPLGGQIKGVLADRHGFVWSGTDTLGLQRLDTRTGRFRHYRRGTPDDAGLPHETMLCSLEAHDGTLWFGFVTCLARYDRDEDSFEKFEHHRHDPASLGNNMVMALHQDADGTIWAGTAGGLNRMIRHAAGSISFQRFGRRQGLEADFIVTIESTGDTLWLGTDRGIVRFRERNGRADVRLFDAGDGIVDPVCHLEASACDHQGRVYFGSNAGFTCFDPSRILPDATPPPVALTGLRMSNIDVEIGGSQANRSVLQTAITFAQQLQIPWNESSVTFVFAALHYRQSDRLRYAYRLEGFDREWVDAGTGTEATYTNLDAGHYRFLVRAANVDGIVSSAPASIELHVEAPPWRRWWAYMLYGIAGAGAVASFTRSRIEAHERELREQRRVERAREEERDIIRRQNAADFHDDAGTTLTRILFMIELARRQTNEGGELRKILETITQDAVRLSHGMRDFIWALDPDQDTLLDTLERIAVVGDGLFSHMEATFTMGYDHGSLADIRLDLTQRRQLMMICKEALHNAARHAGATSVVVAAELANGCLHLHITDDGCGFDASGNGSGYGMKSMRERAENLGATLDLDSTPDSGTRVRLVVPIGT